MSIDAFTISNFDNMQLIFKAITGIPVAPTGGKRHCTCDRKIGRKNRGAGRCLEKFSPVSDIKHLSVPQKAPFPGLIFLRSETKVYTPRKRDKSSTWLIFTLVSGFEAYSTALQ